MKKQDFYFDLPEELIAQYPLSERQNSKLMVLDKESGEIEHKIFKDITENLNDGDCIVLNNTRVLPARIFGYRENTGGKVEILLLNKIEDKTWETLVKPGKKAKIGSKLIFKENILKAEVIDIKEGGTRVLKFEYEGIFEEILDEIGEMPLPHYIKDKLEDKERYQTVYSEHQGSAAAPTAGLHFTKELLDKIKSKGVKIAYITLHVGLGTFRPVKAENILEHKMHSEYYEIDSENASIINNVKKNNGNIIAVGTTSTRTLESACDENGLLKPCSGWTDIFIYPGYKFKIVDKLITNFHLPESTLLMLISALAGKENVIKAYEEAIKNKYRFYSFGDSMFIK